MAGLGVFSARGSNHTRLQARSGATARRESVANIEGNLSRAADSLVVAGDEVGKLAKSLNDTLGRNQDQIAEIINETDRTMKLFQKTLTDADGILGDQKMKDDL